MYHFTILVQMPLYCCKVLIIIIIIINWLTCSQACKSVCECVWELLSNVMILVSGEGLQPCCVGLDLNYQDTLLSVRSSMANFI